MRKHNKSPAAKVFELEMELKSSSMATPSLWGAVILVLAFSPLTLTPENSAGTDSTLSGAELRRGEAAHLHVTVIPD